MQALSAFFLRAKHWQIFLLTTGIGWIGGTSVMLLSVATTHSPEGMLKVAVPFGLLMALSMVCVICWLWSIGSFLASVLPPDLRLRLGFFRFALVYPALYMFVFIAIFTSSNALLLMVLFPLHFFAMFCLFYDFYFVSRSLALAESRTAVSFADYAGTFFLLWVFPVGVWFIQPKINRLVAQPLLAPEGVARPELSAGAAETPDSATKPHVVAQRAYAGFWLRLAAALIDGLVIGFPTFLIFFFVFIVLWKVTVGNGGSGSVALLAAAVIFMLVTPWLYFSLLESSPRQATIGKSAVHLYVADVDGRRLSRGRSMGRNLAKCLSTMSLGFGYLLCAFTARRQALHDLVAHCVVLRR